MSNNLYMPLYVGDYLTDAAHLSAAEHGAYMLLIMNYWQRAEPLPNDDRKLSRIARMTATEWAESRDLILEFFEVVEGTLRHGRIDAELKRAKEKSERARESASNRSTFGRRPNSERKADAKQSLVESSSNKDKDKDKDKDLDKPATAALSAAAVGNPDLEHAKRLCIEATGWKDTQGFSAISDLIWEGVSFDSRILPMLRTIADDLKSRKRAAPERWAFATKAIRDPSRHPNVAKELVSVVWVPVDSKGWKHLLTVKREGILRSMLKTDGKGAEGVWWPARDLPAISEAA